MNILLQVGGRYLSTSISLLKLKTRPLSLMTTAMFSVLSLLFGLTCSMFFWLLDITFSTQEICILFISPAVFLAFVARGGRFSDGWGSCERREKKFSKPNHDIPSTAETRAKNRACQVCSVTESYNMTHMLFIFLSELLCY